MRGFHPNVQQVFVFVYQIGELKHIQEFKTLKSSPKNSNKAVKAGPLLLLWHFNKIPFESFRTFPGDQLPMQSPRSAFTGGLDGSTPGNPTKWAIWNWIFTRNFYALASLASWCFFFGWYDGMTYSGPYLGIHSGKTGWHHLNSLGPIDHCSSHGEHRWASFGAQ